MERERERERGREGEGERERERERERLPLLLLLPFFSFDVGEAPDFIVIIMCRLWILSHCLFIIPSLDGQTMCVLVNLSSGSARSRDKMAEHSQLIEGLSLQLVSASQ